MSKQKVSKVLSICLSLVLIFQQCGFAQVVGQLDIAGHLAKMHQSLAVDKFRPLHLRYLAYDQLNNVFQLLIDKGDLIEGQSPFN